MHFQSINDFKDISVKLDSVRSNNVNADKVGKIFTFIEKLGLVDYKIEFDSERRRYYVFIIDGNQELLSKVITENKVERIVNMEDTNATINITQDNVINFKIIFY